MDPSAAPSPSDSAAEARWSLSQKSVLERGPGLLTCCPHWGLGSGHTLCTGPDGRSAHLKAWDGQSDVWLECRGLGACVRARVCVCAHTCMHVFETQGLLKPVVPQMRYELGNL